MQFALVGLRILCFCNWSVLPNHNPDRWLIHVWVNRCINPFCWSPQQQWPVMKRNATNALALFRFPLKRHWVIDTANPSPSSHVRDQSCRIQPYYIMVSLPLAFSGLRQGIHTEGQSHPNGIQNLINNFCLALEALPPILTNISPGSVHAQAQLP